jgi:diguanylate cyclase (GGDEF)-like protein
VSEAPARDLPAHRERLAEAQRGLPLGRWDDVFAAGGQAFEQATAAGDGLAAAEAGLAVAKACFNTDRLDECTLWCERAQASARAAGAHSMAPAICVVASAAHARAGNTEQAVDSAAAALALLKDVPAADVRRTVYFGVAITYRALGLWRQALATWKAAVEADRGLGTEPASATLAKINLAECAMRAYDDLLEVDAESARAALEAALPLQRELAAEHARLPRGWLRFLCGHVLGALRSRQGDHAEALRLLEQTTAEEDDQRFAVRGAVWLELAWVRQRLGRADEAQAAAREAVSRLVQDTVGRERRRTLPGLHDQWRAERLLGRHEQALALLEQLHLLQSHHLQVLVDANVTGVVRQLSAQTLQLQNADLRQRNEGLARDIQHISRAAQTDALTGAPNRRALDEAFRGLQHSGTPFVLAMIDADHFKQVNDRHSHVVGDAVLQQLARVLSQGLRAPDRLARYGGEEFAVLLAGLSLDEGTAVIERLRKRVAEIDWSDHAAGLRVSISAGVVAVEGHERLDQAVRRADAMLYRAKAEGRNRVVR